MNNYVFDKSYLDRAMPDIVKAVKFMDKYNELSELDKLAVDYYMSGRELALQYRHRKTPSGEWLDFSGVGYPDFNEIVEWRKKPKNKQITIDIFEDLDNGRIVTAEVGEVVHNIYKTAGHWRHLKTVEVEV